MNQVVDTKQALRVQYRKARRAHPLQSEFITSLATQLETILRLKDADSVWASDKAHRSELDLAVPIARIARNFPDVRWAYPRIAKDDSLEFHVPNETHGNFIPNLFLILEPNPEAAEVAGLAKLSGVFIPGLAFDRFGTRLGSGKGYYDKALMGFAGLRIGVGYSVQISDRALPKEQHDIQMDYLLTERDLVKCERSN